MSLLASVTRPADLGGLTDHQLTELAGEIRGFLLDTVCRSGGHLGSNLGAVELTIAVHRVFASPHDPIVFDTGHQAYAHKLLTGRMAAFATLRQRDGLSGYPSRDESVHDVMGNSHASTALAYADGLAKALELSGAHDRTVAAVVGDGSLTGGIAWEALNNLGASRRRVVVVLNDNGRSYSPTAGAIADHLARLRNPDSYHAVVELLGDSRRAQLPEQAGGTVPPGAGSMATVFADLGLAYLGPVDGHDIAAMERTLRQARERLDAGSPPVVVHCVTRKGIGYPPAEDDDIDHLHSVGPVDRLSGQPAKPKRTSWTDVFAGEITELAARRPDVVGVTAAMLHPTGLATMAERFPDRVYDVGIAEQYAVTSAAGLAIGGRHPVVAVYSTFLNRALDQTLFDVGLHELPVTFVLDRAGITGPDGPSHHGLWDLAMLRSVPGMRVAAPRDAARLAEELNEAVSVTDGPTALRFPKASDTEDIDAVTRTGTVDVLRTGHGAEVLLVAVGATARSGLTAAVRAASGGLACTVVDPRWVLPIPPELVELASEYRAVVTVEDGISGGGVGAALAQALLDRGAAPHVRVLGLPTRYLPHGTREELLAHAGIDVDGITAAILDAARQAPAPARVTARLPRSLRRLAGRLAGARAPDDPIDAENFPVALAVLPRVQRDDLTALYRFARYVDDIGDESDGDRERALDTVDTELDTLFAGRAPALPAVRGLRTAVARCGLPDEPFRRLVRANRQDQIVGRYATFDQLREYCRLSADPVGELVLHIFGCATPARVALSDRICTALQVIEHLQDVREDWQRDRVYLPKSDLDRFGVVEADLDAAHASPELRLLLEFEAERASSWLEAGAPLTSTLHGYARLAIGGYVAGGRAALVALRRSGYDPLPGPPKPRRLDILREAALATLRSPG